MKLILVSTYDHQRNLMNELGTNNRVDDETHVVAFGGRAYGRYDEIEDRTELVRNPSAQEHMDRWRSIMRTRLLPYGIWTQPASHSPP